VRQQYVVVGRRALAKQRSHYAPWSGGAGAQHKDDLVACRCERHRTRGSLLCTKPTTSNHSLCIAFPQYFLLQTIYLGRNCITNNWCILTGKDGIPRRRHVDEDPREDVRVGFGVVEFQLNHTGSEWCMVPSLTDARYRCLYWVEGCTASPFLIADPLTAAPPHTVVQPY